MAPEAAAEAMTAYAEETNRLNRERRASGATDRKELADIGKKIATMLDVIEDGGYARGMMDRMRELEARQDEIEERLSAAPVDLPDIHPNIAIVYRRKVERLAEALADPRDRDEAADAIRGLIERIVLTPGAKRGEMDAALHGDLGTILEWAGNGRRKGATDTPRSGMSVSVVAGAGLEPATFRLWLEDRDRVARIPVAVPRFSGKITGKWRNHDQHQSVSRHQVAQAPPTAGLCTCRDPDPERRRFAGAGGRHRASRSSARDRDTRHSAREDRRTALRRTQNAAGLGAARRD